MIILTFHHISPFDDVLTIPPELFEKALLSLKDKFEFITYNEFIDICLHDKKVENKKILITIDDGYLDNYIYAFKVLKKLNIPAVIFTVTGNIIESNEKRTQMPYFKKHKELNKENDKNLFFNSSELDEMLESGLIEIDSHTVEHFICKNKNETDLQKQFNDSLKWIKEKRKTRKEFGFCWPRGSFDDLSLNLIKRSEYKFAFSTIDGAYFLDDDKYTIKRIDCSSWNKNEQKYLKRLKRKIWIYSNFLISRLYSTFRELRIKVKKL